MHSFARVIAGLALAVFAQSGVAAGEPIIDAAGLAAAQARGAIVWDAREAPAFAQGHIPGAVNAGDPNRVLRNAVTEDFIAVPAIEKILGAAGIDPSREVVVYAARASTSAYFGAFTIRHFGGRNVSVYHDGIDGWREAGRPLETAVRPAAPIALALKPVANVAASTAEVIAKLRDPGVQLLDVRTRGEFAGDDVRAIRGGHIPGAINIPYEENWVDPAAAGKLASRQVADNRGMALKTDESLRSLYAKLDPTKETIVYCQSGVRASETASVLERLGFRNVRVYDSSWLGYAAKLDAPAQNEVFFNVGAMNGRLAAMQAQIEALQRELAEARKAAPSR